MATPFRSHRGTRVRRQQRGLSSPPVVAAVLTASALFLFPVFWLLLISLKRDADVFQLPPAWLFWPTLENYRYVLRAANFWGALTNSVTVVGLSVLLSLLAGLPAAYALARLRIQGVQWFLFSILLTRMLPPVALIVPLYSIFRNLGLLDRVLPLALVYTSLHLPYIIWMMYGFFREVPRELEEAAQVDGAGWLGALLRVTVPLSLPAIGATAIFSAIIGWNEFLYALVLTRRDAVTLPVVISTFLDFFTISWGRMAVAGSLATIPVIVFALLVQRNLVRGLTMGALKG